MMVISTTQTPPVVILMHEDDTSKVVIPIEAQANVLFNAMIDDAIAR
jgi:hypothetical protein